MKSLVKLKKITFFRKVVIGSLALILICYAVTLASCSKDTGLADPDIRSNPTPPPGGSSSGSTQTFNVASYNIRYNEPLDGANIWANRKENVKALIKFHEFDIFGVQEAYYVQVTDLALMTEFGWTGKGRDDGVQAGEFSAIFYRKDRFKLVSLGSFWLSETPNVPSKGWDAAQNRICSWGQFEDIVTTKKFFYFNTHFDNTGNVARQESAKLMVAKINEIAGTTSPVIITGDLNSSPTTTQITTLKARLQDSYAVTKVPPYGPVGTSAGGFTYVNNPTNRIDYIFVDKIDVLKYGSITDAKGGFFFSDHLPVAIKAIIP